MFGVIEVSGQTTISLWLTNCIPRKRLDAPHRYAVSVQLSTMRKQKELRGNSTSPSEFNSFSSSNSGSFETFADRISRSSCWSTFRFESFSGIGIRWLGRCKSWMSFKCRNYELNLDVNHDWVFQFRDCLSLHFHGFSPVGFGRRKKESDCRFWWNLWIAVWQSEMHPDWNNSVKNSNLNPLTESERLFPGFEIRWILGSCDSDFPRSPHSPCCWSVSSQKVMISFKIVTRGIRTFSHNKSNSFGIWRANCSQKILPIIVWL